MRTRMWAPLVVSLFPDLLFSRLKAEYGVIGGILTDV